LLRVDGAGIETWAPRLNEQGLFSEITDALSFRERTERQRSLTP
jgi:hypothetical protein